MSEKAVKLQLADASGKPVTFSVIPSAFLKPIFEMFLNYLRSEEGQAFILDFIMKLFQPKAAGKGRKPVAAQVSLAPSAIFKPILDLLLQWLQSPEGQAYIVAFIAGLFTKNNATE